MTPGSVTRQNLLTLTRWTLCLASLFVVISVLPLDAQQKVEGQVINGTTSQPVARQLVQLLVVGAGMRELTTSKTDSAGRFTLVPPSGDTGPFFLVQTVYEGVNYRARVEDRGLTKITVYDTTNTPPPLHIKSARIVVEAQGPKAQVQEFFAIENTSSPPRTYSNSNGTFNFRLSKNASDPSAAVLGQMNMPIPQGVMDGKSPGEFLINHALPPGLTVVTVNYEADYSAQSFALEDGVDYPIEHAELQVSPNNLAVESKLFQAAGADSSTGMQRFEASDLPAGATLEARISGEGGSATSAESRGAEGEIQTVPNSMTRSGVPLLVCMLLVLLWGLGVRAAKERAISGEQGPQSQAQKQLESKLDELLNSLADLDKLHESGKIADKGYWKERLELKAKVVAILKQRPPARLESYAPRPPPRGPHAGS